MKKTSGFTEKGYNDGSKHCPKRGCGGKVRPTHNANIGKCDRCGKKISWSHLKK